MSTKYVFITGGVDSSGVEHRLVTLNIDDDLGGGG